VKIIGARLTGDMTATDIWRDAHMLIERHANMAELWPIRASVSHEIRGGVHFLLPGGLSGNILGLGEMQFAGDAGAHE
jgi:hypothetical protein